MGLQNGLNQSPQQQQTANTNPLQIDASGILVGGDTSVVQTTTASSSQQSIIDLNGINGGGGSVGGTDSSPSAVNQQIDLTSRSASLSSTGSGCNQIMSGSNNGLMYDDLGVGIVDMHVINAYQQPMSTNQNGKNSIPDIYITPSGGNKNEFFLF